MASRTPEEQLADALKAQDTHALYDAVARSPQISRAQLEFLTDHPSPFHDHALLTIGKYLLPHQEEAVIPPLVLDRILHLESYEQHRARSIARGREAATDELLQSTEHAIESARDHMQDYISDLTSPSFETLHRQPSTASEALYRAHASLPVDDAHVAAAILTGKWSLSDLLLERAEIQKQSLGDASFHAALAIAAISDSANSHVLNNLLHHPQFEPNAQLIAKSLFEAQEAIQTQDASEPSYKRAKDIDAHLRDYLLYHPALRKEIGEELTRPNLPVGAKSRAFVEAVNDEDVSVADAANKLIALLRKGYDEKKTPIDLIKLEARGKLQPSMITNDHAVRSALDACPPFDDPEKQERLLDILKEAEVRLAHDGYRRHAALNDYLEKYAIELSPQRIIARSSWGKIER